ncbi:protein RER1B [Sesamum angolense]|uniref:Protein RER1B n=1 Tax=Sesamum angolense TaxID=2727404 RepID=A0AAE1WGW8_9LAMI|nr:protein RER1B [Sesamum angolense]
MEHFHHSYPNHHNGLRRRVTVTIHSVAAVRQHTPHILLPVDRVHQHRILVGGASVRDQGFYMVSYALGLYILNLLIGFLSPQVDPEFFDGLTLPTQALTSFGP